MKKRLYKEKAKELVNRLKYKTRPDYRRAINFVRKYLTRGWKLPFKFLENDNETNLPEKNNRQ